MDVYTIWKDFIIAFIADPPSIKICKMEELLWFAKFLWFADNY